jgi:gamma-glutamyltranspeptidase/glutathione hydrolase
MPYAIAAGHEETVKAAQIVLDNGGNAVDAAISSFLTAMVVEPCMAGVGGGGLALVREPQGRTTSFDFFCQTPINKIPQNDEDFYPVTVDFGGTLEDFYVGAASVAVPGSIAGIYSLYKAYGTVPIRELFATAISLAKQEVPLDHFQAYDLVLLEGICGASRRGREIFFNQDGSLKKEGETLSFPHLADFMEVLSYEGEDFFYKGDIAEYIEKICRERGGHLKIEDLVNYKVNVTPSPTFRWKNTQVHTIGYPSLGSAIITAFMKEIESLNNRLGSKEELISLSHAMRKIYYLSKDPFLLADHLHQSYGHQVRVSHQVKKGGTTHLSIMDRHGMSVSLTTSIGEGSGIFIPGTDIHLNNMLGEEALMSKGFYNWDPDQRLISMMSPTIVEDINGKVLVTGTGGAGRIPYMISLLCHMIFNHNMDLEKGVKAPRLYYHTGVLEVEPGFEIPAAIDMEVNQWDNQTLYFGGTNSVMSHGSEMYAQADARRYGTAICNP